jgi:small subunit ribosomal protein S6
MSEARKQFYEAMFLVSQASATDLAGVVDHINTLLGRAGAEVVAMSKWDERRLAYEIDKQKRGVYILVYFKSLPGASQRLMRDCNLSETIMRVLITRAEHLTEEEMAATDGREALKTEAQLRAEKAERQAERAAEAVSVGAPKAEGEEPEQDETDEQD